jgi:hypothetical protein
VTEENAADRPRPIAQRIGAEDRDGADRRIVIREEQPIEDEGREEAVEEEIVELDGGAERPDSTMRRRWIANSSAVIPSIVGPVSAVTTAIATLPALLIVAATISEFSRPAIPNGCAERSTDAELRGEFVLS